MSPLRRIELTWLAVCGVAALFHPVDAGLAALELMRIM
jgi:hypothetical protein